MPDHDEHADSSAEDLLARETAAVDSDRDRIARRLNDDIIRKMFAVGLRLQATAQLTEGTAQVRLGVAVDDLDLIIAEVRDVVFDCESQPHRSSRTHGAHGSAGAEHGT